MDLSTELAQGLAEWFDEQASEIRNGQQQIGIGLMVAKAVLQYPEKGIGRGLGNGGIEGRQAQRFPQFTD